MGTKKGGSTFQEQKLPLHLLKARLNELPLRSKNVLLTYLREDEDNTLKWTDLFREDFPFTSIRNCGSNTAEALRIFFRNLKAEVLTFQALEGQDRLWFSFVVKASERFGLPAPYREAYKPLQLLDDILSHSHIISDGERLTMRVVLAVYTDHPKKMNDLTNEFSVSSGRVRGLRAATLDKIQNILGWLRLHQPLSFTLPFGDQPAICLNESMSDELNRAQGVKFSRYFLTWYIALMHPKYRLLGKLEDVFFASERHYRDFHKWRCLYAVTDSLPTDVLHHTVEALDKHLRSLRKQLSTLHIGPFMPKPAADKAADPAWHAALKTVLQGEFDLSLREDGSFVLAPNGRRHLTDYFYFIMDENGSRMTANQIFEQMNENHPEVKCSRNSIVPLIASDDRFVHYGRRIYGLKKWHNVRPKQ